MEETDYGESGQLGRDSRLIRPSETTDDQRQGSSRSGGSMYRTLLEREEELLRRRRLWTDCRPVKHPLSNSKGCDGIRRDCKTSMHTG